MENTKFVLVNQDLGKLGRLLKYVVCLSQTMQT